MIIALNVIAKYFHDRENHAEAITQNPVPMKKIKMPARE
jgi:hypothetical protein